MKILARGQVQFTEAERGEGASALSFSPAVLSMQDELPSGSSFTNWWQQYEVLMRVMKGGENVTAYATIPAQNGFVVSDSSHVTFTYSKVYLVEGSNNTTIEKTSITTSDVVLDIYYRFRITNFSDSADLNGYFDVKVEIDTTTAPDNIEHDTWEESYRYHYNVIRISRITDLEELMNSIDDDTILDPVEKSKILAKWIEINGSDSFSNTTGTTGTYWVAKNKLETMVVANTDNNQLRQLIVYENTIASYGQYDTTELDNAYTALKSYLSGLNLSSSTNTTNFDRSVLAEKLRNYYVALERANYYLADNVSDALDEHKETIAEALSDYEYLKDALKEEDLTTEIEDGLILSNIIGVKDNNHNVVAALNGLGTLPGFSGSHGTIMLATGITNLEPSGNDEISATTKIYADGTIVSNNAVFGGPEGIVINGSTGQVTFGQNCMLEFSGDVTITQQQFDTLLTNSQQQISGTKITNNSITSSQIAANAITADKIAANSITADKIAVNAITSDKIDTSNLTVSASQVSGLASVATTGSYNSLSNRPTIPDISNLADKDDFARKLGYTNYNTLVTAASSNNTIISGGYINTDLIQANAITADKINTQNLTISSSQVTDLSDQYMDKATYIQGAFIKTGLIDVNTLQVKHLNGADGSFTGSINVNNNFNVDASGNVTANSITLRNGVLGGSTGNFTFGYSNGVSYLYSGKSGLNTSGNGIYIGTDGIALGNTFKVTNDGTISLSYNNLSNKPTIPTDVSQLTDTNGTYITPTSITTLNVTANNLKVKAANISDKLTASQLDLSGAVIDASQVTNLPEGVDLSGYAKTEDLPTNITDLIGGANVLHSTDVTVAQAVTANGLTTRTITVGGQSFTEIEGGDFILTNIGKGTDSNGSNYIRISNDGLLKARNALIYGTIYATDGYFGGANGVYISGNKVHLGTDVVLDWTPSTSVDWDNISNKPTIPSDLSDLTDTNGTLTTFITRDSLTTNKITANEIDATNLKVAAVNITGQLTASQINASGLTISASDVSGLGDLATKNSISKTDLDSTIISGGYIKTGLINTGAITISSSNVTGLGDLATQDYVGLSDLNSTIISGGYIKTSLINTGAITISSSQVSDLDLSDYLTDADLSDYMDKTTWISGGYIKTSKIKAEELEVSAAKIQGQLTASQINATNLHVDAANIDGTITATAVSATSGTIGGWSLDTNKIYSGSSTGYVALNSNTSSINNYAIWAGNETASSAPFSVTRSGQIKATEGVIGGIYLNANGLLQKSGTTCVSFFGGNSSFATTSDGFLTIAAGINSNSPSASAFNVAPFRVYSNGAVYASNLSISGGTIGPFTIANDRISYHNGTTLFEIKNNGLSLQTNAMDFDVDNAAFEFHNNYGDITLDSNGFRGYNHTTSSYTPFVYGLDEYTISIVSSLPSNPNSNILYFVTS